VLAALPTLVASMLTVTAPVDGSADCPSPRQVTEALNRLAPGSVLAGDGTPDTASGGAGANGTAGANGAAGTSGATGATSAGVLGAPGLRLSVGGTPAGDVRIDLTDARGEIVLRRLLRAPERAQLSDCTALAETTALIVERYLREVGYEAPTLPPPDPIAGPKAPPPTPRPVDTATVDAARARPARVAWRLGVVASARGGDAGGFDGDGALAVSLEGVGDGPRLGVRLSGGIAPRAHARWSMNETADLLRVPLRLGLYVRVPVGPGHLEPGLGGGVDAFFLTTNGSGGASSRHLAPFGDLALGYAVPVTGPLYVKILARAAVAVPYDFKVLAGEDVWTTPRFLGEAGVELGFVFR
jgi:hypothetical protein